jgi:hypothetical protein
MEANWKGFGGGGRRLVATKTNAGIRRSIAACPDAESVSHVHFTRLAVDEASNKAFQFILNDIDPNYSPIC